MKSPDRYLAIDALRGFALVTIFINHVPGTIFERLTHKNFGLSDSAEVFVLLAGVGAALAYLRPFRAGDAARQIFRMVVRAVQIYAAHLVVLVVCGAIVAAAALSYHDPRILEAMNFETVASSPIESLLGIATLGLQPSYLNILPLYVVLLLMAPALIALVAHRPRLSLLFSAGVYVAAQFGAVPPSYPQESAWFFNPFAWQLLFVIGLCAGGALVERRPIRRPAWVLPLCVAYLAAGLAWKQLEFYPEGVLGLPRFLWDDDKHLLSVPRLLHVLALAWVVTALPLERWLRQAPVLAPLGWMGRNSLVVFSIGTILAIGGQVLRIIGAGDPSLDVAIIGLGLALQVGLAWALEWNRSGLKPQSERVEAGAPVSAQR